MVERWIYWFEELGQDKKRKPVKIYSDNAAVVKGSEDERNVNYWKHKYLKIKEWQDEGYIKVKKIRGEENPADIFTKALGKQQIKHLTEKMLDLKENRK